MNGVLHAIDSLSRQITTTSTTAIKIVWVSLVSEPILYIDSAPFVLRDYFHSFRTLKEFEVGLTSTRLAEIERRLKVCPFYVIKLSGIWYIDFFRMIQFKKSIKVLALFYPILKLRILEFAQLASVFPTPITLFKRRLKFLMISPVNELIFSMNDSPVYQ